MLSHTDLDMQETLDFCLYVSEQSCLTDAMGLLLPVRRQYDPLMLERAINAVMSGTMTQSKAARVFGVPQTTISGRVKKLKP